MSSHDPAVQRSAEAKLRETPLSAENFTSTEIEYLASKYLSSQITVQTNEDMRIQRELVMGEERATALAERARVRCRSIGQILREAKALGLYHPPEPYGA